MTETTWLDSRSFPALEGAHVALVVDACLDLPEVAFLFRDGVPTLIDRNELRQVVEDESLPLVELSGDRTAIEGFLSGTIPFRSLGEVAGLMSYDLAGLMVLSGIVQPSGPVAT